MVEQKIVNIMVTWRGKKLNVEMYSGSTLKEFGDKLQQLTNVKPDTMRLLVPKSSDSSSRLLTPFSDDHSSLSLKESSVLEGRTIRMMGVFEDEIEEVSLNGNKADLRIAGFDEAERRLRQRMLIGPRNLTKLPEGAYIFCDFRTLQLPGIELNPPASEALKIMHKLAADPGIVAIMNKHRWRVGVMTEMAPVGYVGISSQCILGYNKNHGEEISLRLRTDDLKGFRKYERIKTTLLHELAHMVYSEHDAHFYALDKQLNQEAVSLDWTRSKSHTVSGLKQSSHYEDESYEEITGSGSQKLGGKAIVGKATARATSVAAAYSRFVASNDSMERREVDVEPDPDDSGCKLHAEPDPDDSIMQVELPMEIDKNPDCGADHGDEVRIKLKDSGYGEATKMKPYSGFHATETLTEFNPDGSEKANCTRHSTMDGLFGFPWTHAEPDPDDSKASKMILVNGLAEPDPDDSLDDTKTKGSVPECTNSAEPDPDDLQDASTEANKLQGEPDPDDSVVKKPTVECREDDEPDPDDTLSNRIIQHTDLPAIEFGEDNVETNRQQKELESDDFRMEEDTLGCGNNVEPDPDDSTGNGALQPEYNGDESNEGTGNTLKSFNSPCDAPDPNKQELQRIQDPVSLMCSRIQKNIEMLKSEVSSMEATSVLQTLSKIIRNVIEHPLEIKFRRLRKANPQFQRNVAKYKAAMEILFVVGFNEESVSDEIGRFETYVVLKRNDPGLLWLAKSSLEMCIAD